MSVAIEIVERGLAPDALTRAGMRRLIGQRLREETDKAENNPHAVATFAKQMAESPIALVPEKANEQHYEVPAEFFEMALGKRRKYSGCFFRNPDDDLDTAEETMLALTCERAQIADGQHILELGCGWGSLTLWMAEHFPNAKITAVSNSHSQRRFIEGRCRECGFSNVKVVTCDMNRFETDPGFDRVVSVEMFEHMRNWKRLFEKIAHWLKPEGKLFIHVFAHRTLAYEFETEGDHNWMGQHFFTGGIMPSTDLASQFADHLREERQWWVDGTHYARTARAWLQNIDECRDDSFALLESVYGDGLGKRWHQRWRMFFMACEELFNWREGSEWGVSHHLLAPR